MNISKQQWGIAGGIAAVIFLVLLISGSKSQEVISEYEVTQGSISNQVRVFGRAEPEKTFTLSFEISGKLTAYPYEVGDSVKKGARLATLSSSNIQANIRKAASQVTVEKSKLAELGQPDTPEEINIQLAKIEKQEQVINDFGSVLREDILQARNEFADILDDTLDKEYLRADDTEDVLLRLREVDDLSDTARDALGMARVAIQLLYNSLSSVTDLQELDSQFSQMVRQADSLMQELIDLLKEETTVQASRTLSDLEDNQEQLEDLLASLTASRNNFNTAESDLQILQEELVVKQTGASGAAKDVQQSIIASRQQEVNALYSDLTKYRINSPLTGKVFQTFVDQFENVSANSPVISVIPDEPFVIRSNVAESDIVFVGVGNTAEVTFDAIPGEAFLATVSFTEEAVDESRAAPSYETTFVFDEGQDTSAIKSGMTANITVTSGLTEDVLFIPANYLLMDNEQLTVQLLQGDEFIDRVVTTGLRTNTGLVEITSGLQAGDVIVLLN